MNALSVPIFPDTLAFSYQSLANGSTWKNAGVRFGEVFARNLTIEPWLRMTDMEQADRKRLLPVSAYRTLTARFAQ